MYAVIYKKVYKDKVLRQNSPEWDSHNMRVAYVDYDSLMMLTSYFEIIPI